MLETTETTLGSVGDSGMPQAEEVVNTIHGRSENSGTTMDPFQVEQEASTGTPTGNAGDSTILEASAATNGSVGNSSMPEEAEQEEEFNIHTGLHSLGTAASLSLASHNHATVSKPLAADIQEIKAELLNVMREYARAQIRSGITCANVEKETSDMCRAICREEERKICGSTRDEIEFDHSKQTC